jgi:hypothetical protein
MLCLFIVARPGGASRGISEHSEGKGGESDVAILRFPCGSPRLCRLRTAPFLAPMVRLELCTDRMSGFMGANKLSSFCNYYVEPHLLASCGAFTFGGRMKPRPKTSSRE